MGILERLQLSRSSCNVQHGDWDPEVLSRILACNDLEQVGMPDVCPQCCYEEGKRAGYQQAVIELGLENDI